MIDYKKRNDLITDIISKLTNTKKYIIERKVQDYINDNHWL